MNLQQWLKSNTYHHSQFWDLRKMIAEKERRNLRLSLCIPTLNEGKTIGKEIVLFKSELMTRYPLLDEIAVIDSGSTDNTREVAAAFGADVHLSSEILPELGEKKGKGENLWKALYQLKGDIIVYIDADIKNIRPHFISGLLGPLIYRPEVMYVKAFYDRPLTSPNGVRPSEGGRVTEILVRPLFSMFFPELTGLIQPLAGEYAARREVLDRLPFPIGYGVETSHIIDVYKEWGLDAFAQTDMDQRVHRNQATRDLGRMAFAILRTFFRRLHSMGMIRELPDINAVLRQFQFNAGVYEPVEWEWREDERQPMLEVPAYRALRGLPPRSAP